MTNLPMERYKKLKEAEDFYYKKDGGLHEAERVILLGGDNQALLDCYGKWVVVNEKDIFLPNEISEQELIAHYERQGEQ